jgi:hypothetical protein
MKKYFIILLILIAIPKITLAMPIIENVSVNPQSLWIGESPIISLNCYDNESKAITNVYSNTVGPGIILPRLDFTGGYDSFTGDYSLFKSYLDRAGNYSVMLFCNNSDDQSANASTNFTISKLTSYISSINPSPGYIGDELEIDFFVKKDNAPLSSGVIFNVTLNDQLKQLKIAPAYDLAKGWILKIDSPPTEGIYNLDVYAFYDRTNVTNSSSIKIIKKIDFGIVSLSQIWVEGNENITVSLKAKDRGNVIDLNNSNLNIQIASTNLNILSVNRDGDLYDVLITTPSISAGVYNIVATLNYNGNSYSDSKEIDYIVDVNGKIVDNDKKGISTQIRFISNDIEKLKISTDSAGYYSSTLPPGTYDVQITFPQSTLTLKEVSVNSFDDPIKYFYSSDYLVPGIRNAGLFSYEVALTYYEADLEMNYNENNVLDESDMVIYKCSIWNAGRKICNDKWVEIGGDIDTIRNLVKIELNSLSAFIIGEKKEINANFNLDSQKYYTGSLVNVRGYLKDVDGDAVPNATIKAYVKNTQINVETSSDNNGVFSFEFKAPEDEGNYTLILNASKSPYISFNGNNSFETFKNREIMIVTPDTIKLSQGQNSTQEFSITNVGQADLFGLNISLNSIPNNYYNISNFVERIKQNEEIKLYVYFSIPEDAEKKTYSASLAVFNNEIKQDKIFGFTVTGKNETVEQNITNPSGRFILPTLPNFDYNMIYIIIFAIFCFSSAIILKKMRIKKSKRNDIKDFLFDIKNSLKKKNVALTKKDEFDYKELISSAFPNALKNGKHGKDN